MRKLGFTVVEIVITLAVISILAAVGTLAYSSFEKDTQYAEIRSMVSVVQNALERYYNENGEYPSSTALAGGGNGRNLSPAQYNSIASTLNIDVKSLQNKDLKFVPCSINNTACNITEADRRSVIYATRMPSDVSVNPNPIRTYTTPTSGCTYSFSASTTAAETGYTAYWLFSHNPTDNNNWTMWRAHASAQGRLTAGPWCPRS